MSGESIALNGNALDVAFIETSTMSRTMVVAIDNIHKPGSTIDVRDDKVRNKFPALLLRWSLTIAGVSSSTLLSTAGRSMAGRCKYGERTGKLRKGRTRRASG
jgi:hypothetical protein